MSKKKGLSVKDAAEDRRGAYYSEAIRPAAHPSPVTENSEKAVNPSYTSDADVGDMLLTDEKSYSWERIQKAYHGDCLEILRLRSELREVQLYICEQGEALARLQADRDKWVANRTRVTEKLETAHLHIRELEAQLEYVRATVRTQEDVLKEQEAQFESLDAAYRRAQDKLEMIERWVDARPDCNTTEYCMVELLAILADK